MIGIIGGTGVPGERLLTGKKKIVKTPYGDVTLHMGEFAFLPRHGLKKDTPPHKINHRANIYALKKIGVEKIIGVNSVGSLKKEIRLPAILIPHDYINFAEIPTFYDSEIKHITPSLDEGLRRTIIKEAKRQKINVIDKGVYAQTRGPRLETKAEIKMLKNFADVVGMTMASEATLARELELRYASICSVDNYAHGLTNENLDFEKVVKNAKKNSEVVVKLLKYVIKLAG